MSKYLDYEGLKTYNTKVKTKTDNLQSQIDNLKAIGRYLSGWDCTTGEATTNPPTTPYNYKTGDYFIVSKVGATNYKPTGTAYTKSTTVETEVVKVNDYYRYDGTSWHLEINTQRDVTFTNIGGDAYDNDNLANYLNLMNADISGAASLATQAASSAASKTEVSVGGIFKSVWDADTKQDKITTTNKLPYSLISGTPTIYDWALQATKPTYTASEVGARPSTWTPSKSDVGLGNVGNFKAVSTLSGQGLTDTEKANARTNIGAGTSSFSGDYNDLSNKPTIPTVYNATLTIQKNGSSVGTFTSNASSAKTINITVPTQASDVGADVAGAAAAVQTTLTERCNNLSSDINALNSNKVDNLLLPFVIYATNMDGTNIGVGYSDDADELTFALRGYDGRLKVGTPTEDDDAATKAYVDAATPSIDTITTAEINALVL